MSTFWQNRRTWLRSAAGLALGGTAAGVSAVDAPWPPGQKWDRLAASYDVAPNLANLENGYYGIMARPVAEDFKRNIDYLNRHNAYFLRREFDREGVEAIRSTLAAYAGAATGEIVLTRGATESLQLLIANYRLLKEGDTLMVGNLDYDAMIDAMQDKAHRHGCAFVKVELPEPTTRQNVIDAYDKALRANPRTRLLLLTHVSHRTGLVLPVEELIRLAKGRNVDVILDAAHSWGQLDYRIPALGADFVGANLHKWIGAPLGLGFLYIRANRLQDIAVERGNSLFPETDIRARAHTGTTNAAAVMTIPSALKFHARIPLAERSAHLRGLRDHWVRQVRDLPQVEVLTPEEAGMAGAITSFRLKGRTSFEANAALARTLADEYRIFTVARSGAAGGGCIRVTPSWYTRKPELDRLAQAIRTLAART